MNKYILGIALGLVLLFTGFHVNVDAQTKVFDKEIYWTWPTSGNDYGGYGFYWWHRNEGVVMINYGDMSSTDWISPQNFYNGEFVMRVEVIEQPTSNPFYVQFGIWQDKNKGAQHPETVAGRQYLSGGAGSVFEGSLGSPSTWWNKEASDKVDFSRPEDFYRIGVVLWNESPLCIPMGLDWSSSGCPENASKYFPMRARVTIMAYPASSVPKYNVKFKVADESAAAIGGANIAVAGQNITTNTSGEASLDLINGTYNYTVTKSGFTQQTGSVTVSGANVTKNVTMTQAVASYTVTFNVKDAGSNAIQGATVAINGNNLTTNASGVATISLPNGSYNYTVSKSGYQQNTGSVSVSGANISQNVTLNATTYTVTFNVKDGSSANISGATVAINGTNLTTNASGVATINLPNGNYPYTVSKSGFQSNSGSVDVAGAAVTKNVTLIGSSYTVTFNVKDAGSVNISGATVAINGTNLTTNSSGVATINLPDGNYPYTVSKSGYQQNTGSVDVDGAAITKNITLSASSYTVTFNVKDAGSNPIAGATVAINGTNLTTNSSGVATIDLVNANYPYTVSKTGYQSSTGSVDVAGAAVTKNISLVTSSYTLTFNVRDAGASAIQGATIAINGSNLTTNSSGVATISLSNGSYNYTVSAAGYQQNSGSVNVSGAAVTQNVTLSPSTYTVTFKVIDENANAVEGAGVSVNGSNLTTNATGNATTNLENGTFSYQVSKAGFEGASGMLTVSGNELTEIVILTSVKFEITFIITDPQAHPVEGASLSVGGNTVTSESNGKAPVSLANGTHNYTVSKSGYLPSTGSVTVAGAAKNVFVSITSTTTGIFDDNARDGKNNTISVYPNPGTGLFQVKKESAFDNDTKFEVYTITGTRVFARTIEFESDQFDLNLTHLPQGVYLLQIRSNGTLETRKIAIQQK